MKNPQTIPDVQGKKDQRHLPINRVGIRKIKIPLSICNGDGKDVNTVAEAEMTVSLPHDQKGTHMSRFIHMLNRGKSLKLTDLGNYHREMLGLLNATEGSISLNFPFFMEKTAPVSAIKSLMDYNVVIFVDGGVDDSQVFISVTVPVTSLCPCSKEISEYGAHNQRSHIIIKALYQADNPFTIEKLIEIAENGGSCPIWSTLKRPDEKYVTEHAYENPKFVEDIVRDVAGTLNQESTVLAYEVSSENFESIHNHSAYAFIAHDKRK